MKTKMVVPERVDKFGREYPRLIGVVIGILMLIVVYVELLTTNAPLVLYQAF